MMKPTDAIQTRRILQSPDLLAAYIQAAQRRLEAYQYAQSNAPPARQLWPFARGNLMEESIRKNG